MGFKYDRWDEYEKKERDKKKEEDEEEESPGGGSNIPRDRGTGGGRDRDRDRGDRERRDDDRDQDERQERKARKKARERGDDQEEEEDSGQEERDRGREEQDEENERARAAAEAAREAAAREALEQAARRKAYDLQVQAQAAAREAQRARELAELGIVAGDRSKEAAEAIAAQRRATAFADVQKVATGIYRGTARVVSGEQTAADLVRENGVVYRGPKGLLPLKTIGDYVRAIESHRNYVEERRGAYFNADWMKIAETGLSEAIDDYVRRRAKVKRKFERISDRASHGDASAIKDWEKLEQTSEYKWLVRVGRQLNPKKPGELGLLDRWTLDWNRINRMREQYLLEWGDRYSVPGGTSGSVGSGGAEPKGVGGEQSRTWTDHVRLTFEGVRRVPGWLATQDPDLQQAAIDERARVVYEEALVKYGGGMALRLYEQNVVAHEDRGRAFLEPYLKRGAEASGLVYDPERMFETGYAQWIVNGAIQAAMKDWEAVNPMVVRPEVDQTRNPLDPVPPELDEYGMFGPGVLEQYEWDARRGAEREKWERLFYKFVFNTDPPGQFERLLNTTIASPPVDAALQLLSLATSTPFGLVRLGAGFFGRLTGTQVNVGAITGVSAADVVAALNEYDPSAPDVFGSGAVRTLEATDESPLGGYSDLVGPMTREEFDWQGFNRWKQDTEEGRRFWSWFEGRDERVRPVWQQPEWGMNMFGTPFQIGMDRSPEAIREETRERVRIQKAVLGEDGLAKTPLDWIWHAIRTINEYGGEPFDPSRGNLMNALTWGADITMLAKFSRLPRIVQETVRASSEIGNRGALRLFRDLLVENRFGFSAPQLRRVGPTIFEPKGGFVGPLPQSPRYGLFETGEIDRLAELMFKREISKATVGIGAATYPLPKTGGAVTTVKGGVGGGALPGGSGVGAGAGAPVIGAEEIENIRAAIVGRRVLDTTRPLTAAQVETAVEGVVRILREQLEGVRTSVSQVRRAAEDIVEARLAIDKVRVVSTRVQDETAGRVGKAVKEAAERKATKAAEEAKEVADRERREAAQRIRERRQRIIQQPRRSVYERTTDFEDVPATGQRPRFKEVGDFRAPKAYRRRGVVLSRGPKVEPPDPKKPDPGTLRVYAVADVRHAEDVIAIADDIARRHGVALNWVKGPSHVRKGYPIVELVGADRDVMARVADDLERTMVRARVGSTTSKLPWRKVDSGRVVYRDEWRDQARDALSRSGDPGGVAARDPVKLLGEARAVSERAQGLADRLAPRLEPLEAERKRLMDLAAAGDVDAAREAAKLVGRQRRLLERIDRLEGFAKEYRKYVRGQQARVRSPVVAEAQRIVLGRQLLRDEQFAKVELVNVNRALRGKIGATARARYERRRVVLGQAIEGARLLRSELNGPVHVVDQLVAAHAGDAKSLMPSNRVAPYVEAGPGLTTDRALDLETARELHALVVSRVVGDSRWLDVDGSVALIEPYLGALRRRHVFGSDQMNIMWGGPFHSIWPHFARRVEWDVLFLEFDESKRWMGQVLEDLESAGLDMKELMVRAERVAGPGASDVEVQYAALRLVHDASAAVYVRDTPLSWSEFLRVNELVAGRVRDQRQWEVQRFAGTGPSAWWEDPSGLVQVRKDFDDDILDVKAMELDKLGMPVDVYDEARSLFQRAVVRRERARYLVGVASGAPDYREAFLAERDVVAGAVAGTALRHWGAQQPWGLSPGELWDDFRRSEEEQQLRGQVGLSFTPFQVDLAERAVDELTQSVPFADAVAPIAPPVHSMAAARQFLVERGFWTPKTAQDINLGRRPWSAADERQYYQDNWGITPPWVNEGWLEEIGAFDSESIYENVMVQLEVYDRSVDVNLRVGGLDAPEQRLRLVFGDQAMGIKPARSIAEKAEWIRMRWGDDLADKRFPWLMDVRGPEYERYYHSRVSRVVDESQLPPDEAASFARVNRKVGIAHHIEVMEDVGQSDVVLAQTLLDHSLRVADELMSDPEWRPRFRVARGGKRSYLGRDRPLRYGLNLLGMLQRLDVVTQIAFPIANTLEVSRIGTKRALLNVATRDVVGYNQLPEEVRHLVPDLASVGVTGNTIWERVGSSHWTRFRRREKYLLRHGWRHFVRRPFADVNELVDAAREGLGSAYELGLVISSNAEDSLKLQLARRHYWQFRMEAIGRGYADEAADAIARLQTKNRIGHFFPSLSGAPLFVKVLDQIIPFLHYNFAATTFYAREFASHPWLIRMLWVMGNVVEDVNRADWAAQHPGLPYPDDGKARMLNIRVGDTTFAVDFKTFGDVFKGLTPFVMMSDGKPDQLAKVLYTFFRIPHPWQQNLWAWLTGGTDVTGQPATIGSFVWQEKTLKFLGGLFNDGVLSQEDVFRLFTRVAFFSEPYALDPLESLNTIYWGLPEGRVRTEFLAEHPELVAYWQQTGREPTMLKGHPKPSWVREHSPQEVLDFDRAQDGYDRLVEDWDRRLEAFLVGGGSPEGDAWKDLKAQRKLDLTRWRVEHPELIDFSAYYAAGDLEGRMREAYVDKLFEQLDGMAAFMPKRKDYPKGEAGDIAFKVAVRDYYRDRARFIAAHPELGQRMAQGRSDIEQAAQDILDHAFELRDEISSRNIAIARAERRGDWDLVDVLREMNEFDYDTMDMPTILSLQREVPEFADKGPMGEGGAADPIREFYRTSMVQVLVPGESDRRYRDASPVERREMEIDWWYGKEMDKIFSVVDESNSPGREFNRRINAKEFLREEYFRRNPGERKTWGVKTHYYDVLDRIIPRAQRTGNWEPWFDALRNDRRFREEYFRRHPGKAREWKANQWYIDTMGALVRRAQSTGDWSIFWNVLKKNRRLREMYFKNNPDKRRTWEGNQRYLGIVGPVVSRAKRTGDWEPWYRLLRENDFVREMYFRNNPGAQQRYEQGQQYFAAMGNWVRLMERDPGKGMQYYDSLPRWMRERYEAKHGEMGRRGVRNNAYTRAMKEWVSYFERDDGEGGMRFFDRLPEWIRNKYFSTHPGQRERFAQNQQYFDAMGKWVRLHEAGKHDEADAFFDKLPSWIKERYRSGRGDGDGKGGRKGGFSGPPPWEVDERWGKVIGEYMLMTPDQQVRYLATHREFREYLRKRDSEGEYGRRAMILAGLAALPDDPWLKRVYQARYPEIFSDQAVYERRMAKLEAMVKEHPELKKPWEDMIQVLVQTYLGQIKYYGEPPRELDRVTQEEWLRRKKWRKRRHHRREWEFNKPMSEVPGLQNVLSGLA